MDAELEAMLARIDAVADTKQQQGQQGAGDKRSAPSSVPSLLSLTPDQRRRQLLEKALGKNEGVLAGLEASPDNGDGGAFSPFSPRARSADKKEKGAGGSGDSEKKKDKKKSRAASPKGGDVGDEKGESAKKKEKSDKKKEKDTPSSSAATLSASASPPAVIVEGSTTYMKVSAYLWLGATMIAQFQPLTALNAASSSSASLPPPQRGEEGYEVAVEAAASLIHLYVPNGLVECAKALHAMNAKAAQTLAASSSTSSPSSDSALPPPHKLLLSLNASMGWRAKFDEGRGKWFFMNLVDRTVKGWRLKELLGGERGGNSSSASSDTFWTDLDPTVADEFPYASSVRIPSSFIDMKANTARREEREEEKRSRQQQQQQQQREEEEAQALQRREEAEKQKRLQKEEEEERQRLQKKREEEEREAQQQEEERRRFAERLRQQEEEAEAFRRRRQQLEEAEQEEKKLREEEARAKQEMFEHNREHNDVDDGNLHPSQPSSSSPRQRYVTSFLPRGFGDGEGEEEDAVIGGAEDGARPPPPPPLPLRPFVEHIPSVMDERVLPFPSPSPTRRGRDNLTEKNGGNDDDDDDDAAVVFSLNNTARTTSNSKAAVVTAVPSSITSSPTKRSASRLGVVAASLVAGSGGGGGLIDAFPMTLAATDGSSASSAAVTASISRLSSSNSAAKRVVPQSLLNSTAVFHRSSWDLTGYDETKEKEGVGEANAASYNDDHHTGGEANQFANQRFGDRAEREGGKEGNGTDSRNPSPLPQHPPDTAAAAPFEKHHEPQQYDHNNGYGGVSSGGVTVREEDVAHVDPNTMAAAISNSRSGSMAMAAGNGTTALSLSRRSSQDKAQPADADKTERAVGDGGVSGRGAESGLPLNTIIDPNAVRGGGGIVGVKGEAPFVIHPYEQQTAVISNSSSKGKGPFTSAFFRSASSSASAASSRRSTSAAAEAGGLATTTPSAAAAKIESFRQRAASLLNHNANAPYSSVGNSRAGSSAAPTPRSHSVQQQRDQNQQHHHQTPHESYSRQPTASPFEPTERHSDIHDTNFQHAPPPPPAADPYDGYEAFMAQRYGTAAELKAADSVNTSAVLLLSSHAKEEGKEENSKAQRHDDDYDNDAQINAIAATTDRQNNTNDNKRHSSRYSSRASSSSASVVDSASHLSPIRRTDSSTAHQHSNNNTALLVGNGVEASPGNPNRHKDDDADDSVAAVEEAAAQPTLASLYANLKPIKTPTIATATTTTSSSATTAAAPTQHHRTSSSGTAGHYRHDYAPPSRNSAPFASLLAQGASLMGGMGERGDGEEERRAYHASLSQRRAVTAAASSSLPSSKTVEANSMYSSSGPAAGSAFTAASATAATSDGLNNDTAMHHQPRRLSGVLATMAAKENETMTRGMLYTAALRQENSHRRAQLATNLLTSDETNNRNRIEHDFTLFYLHTVKPMWRRACVEQQERFGRERLILLEMAMATKLFVFSMPSTALSSESAAATTYAVARSYTASTTALLAFVLSPPTHQRGRGVGARKGGPNPSSPFYSMRSDVTPAAHHHDSSNLLGGGHRSLFPYTATTPAPSSPSPEGEKGEEQEDDEYSFNAQKFNGATSLVVSSHNRLGGGGGGGEQQYHFYDNLYAPIGGSSSLSYITAVVFRSCFFLSVYEFEGMRYDERAERRDLITYAMAALQGMYHIGSASLSSLSSASAARRGGVRGIGGNGLGAHVFNASLAILSPEKRRSNSINEDDDAILSPSNNRANMNNRQHNRGYGTEHIARSQIAIDEEGARAAMEKAFRAQCEAIRYQAFQRAKLLTSLVNALCDEEGFGRAQIEQSETAVRFTFVRRLANVEEAEMGRRIRALKEGGEARRFVEAKEYEHMQREPWHYTSTINHGHDGEPTSPPQNRYQYSADANDGLVPSFLSSPKAFAAATANPPQSRNDGGVREYADERTTWASPSPSAAAAQQYQHQQQPFFHEAIDTSTIIVSPLTNKSPSMPTYYSNNHQHAEGDGDQNSLNNNGASAARYNHHHPSSLPLSPWSGSKKMTPAPYTQQREAHVGTAGNGMTATSLSASRKINFGSPQPATTSCAHPPPPPPAYASFDILKLAEWQNALYDHFMAVKEDFFKATMAMVGTTVVGRGKGRGRAARLAEVSSNAVAGASSAHLNASSFTATTDHTPRRRRHDSFGGDYDNNTNLFITSNNNNPSSLLLLSPSGKVGGIDDAYVALRREKNEEQHNQALILARDKELRKLEWKTRVKERYYDPSTAAGGRSKFLQPWSEEDERRHFGNDGAAKLNGDNTYKRRVEPHALTDSYEHPAALRQHIPIAMAHCDSQGRVYEIVKFADNNNNVNAVSSAAPSASLHSAPTTMPPEMTSTFAAYGAALKKNATSSSSSASQQQQASSFFPAVLNQELTRQAHKAHERSLKIYHDRMALMGGGGGGGERRTLTSPQPATTHNEGDDHSTSTMMRMVVPSSGDATTTIHHTSNTNNNNLLAKGKPYMRTAMLEAEEEEEEARNAQREAAYMHRLGSEAHGRGKQTLAATDAPLNSKNNAAASNIFDSKHVTPNFGHSNTTTNTTVLHDGSSSIGGGNDTMSVWRRRGLIADDIKAYDPSVSDFHHHGASSEGYISQFSPARQHDAHVRALIQQAKASNFIPTNVVLSPNRLKTALANRQRRQLAHDSLLREARLGLVAPPLPTTTAAMATAESTQTVNRTVSRRDVGVDAPSTTPTPPPEASTLSTTEHYEPPHLLSSAANMNGASLSSRVTSNNKVTPRPSSSAAQLLHQTDREASPIPVMVEMEDEDDINKNKNRWSGNAQQQRNNNNNPTTTPTMSRSQSTMLGRYHAIVDVEEDEGEEVMGNNNTNNSNAFNNQHQYDSQSYHHNNKAAPEVLHWDIGGIVNAVALAEEDEVTLPIELSAGAVGFFKVQVEENAAEEEEGVSAVVSPLAFGLGSAGVASGLFIFEVLFKLVPTPSRLARVGIDPLRYYKEILSSAAASSSASHHHLHANSPHNTTSPYRSASTASTALSVSAAVATMSPSKAHMRHEMATTRADSMGMLTAIGGGGGGSNSNNSVIIEEYEKLLQRMQGRGEGRAGNMMMNNSGSSGGFVSLGLTSREFHTARSTFAYLYCEDGSLTLDATITAAKPSNTRTHPRGHQPVGHPFGDDFLAAFQSSIASAASSTTNNHKRRTATASDGPSREKVEVRVTAVLDLDRRELSFIVNGKQQGVAFQFDAVDDPLDVEPLFPIAILGEVGDEAWLVKPSV